MGYNSVADITGLS